MRTIMTLATAAMISALGIGTAAAEEAMHRLAIHIDQNDPAVMNLALNNAQNVRQFYAAKGESVAIEIVAYGPGLEMYVAERSPVTARLSAMSLESPEVVFVACGNTHLALNKKEGREVPLLSEVVEVLSGVVHLMELQDQGYAYVRP